MSGDDGVPGPPHTCKLSASERAAWDYIAPRLWRVGKLPEAFTMSLAQFVQCAMTYLLLQRELTKLCAENPTADSSEVRREVAEWRTLARQWAADFELLSPEVVGLAAVDNRGEDVVLKQLLGVDDAELDGALLEKETRSRDRKVTSDEAPE
jgi:hypothetical protein